MARPNSGVLARKISSSRKTNTFRQNQLSNDPENCIKGAHIEPPTPMGGTWTDSTGELRLVESPTEPYTGSAVCGTKTKNQHHD